MPKCHNCGGESLTRRKIEEYLVHPFGPKGVQVRLENIASERVCDACGERVTIREGITPKMLDGLARFLADSERKDAAAVYSLRKWLGLTQVELGELLGVTDSHVSRWENEHAAIGAQSAAVLRVAVRYHNPDEGRDVRELLAEQRREETDEAAEAMAPGAMFRVTSSTSGVFDIAATG